MSNLDNSSLAELLLDIWIKVLEKLNIKQERESSLTGIIQTCMKVKDYSTPLKQYLLIEERSLYRNEIIRLTRQAIEYCLVNGDQLDTSLMVALVCNDRKYFILYARLIKYYIFFLAKHN